MVFKYFNFNFLRFFPYNYKYFIVGLFIIIFFIYFIIGFYIVKPAEQAVVTRLGKYNRITEQGPNWIPFFIEKKQIINTEKLERSSHYGSYMLTKDENIITAEIEVQYRISDVEKYLFNLVEPDKSLKEAADSALRQVVGYSDLDFLMTLGKEQIASEIHEQLQHILDSYNSGIYVAVVALKDVRIPNDIKNSFDDVIKAQEEKEQLKHQAESFANKVIPEAKGEAARILETANAYKQEVIFIAEGDVIKFKLILAEYKNAPEVTRIRLYLDTLETVFSRTSKVLVDLSGNNIIYLPIDKFLHQAGDSTFFTNKSK
ncbi:FtsH protease activity modulator HflK [Candidatus Azoamicus ciliaticola]|uniref:Protein HflK n=1 Tax=Candidatus Azoamicus ciliaticola TaxID=2652803 RepID=A0A6J5JXP9_9GAMM|nr:FtsH protease activity modulator HflK [Candidatus Azoamicus ciliaticola]CAB3976292.1 Modulator of FtsH protease HflK [Candidatus Azoamicus ciliaticola]